MAQYTENDLKKFKRLAKKLHKEQGIQHTVALKQIAVQLGHKDWPDLSSNVKKA